jgi:hypothetical protein
LREFNEKMKPVNLTDNLIQNEKIFQKKILRHLP